eukprot:8346379-Ditylum_brightwellii.AAC.1
MYNVVIAFEILPDGRQLPVGWKKVNGQLLFDVKIHFTRNARWVLDGHKIIDSEGSKISGVVSREGIRKAYTIYRSEFGLENIRKKVLIQREMCGGNTVGQDFRSHLRSYMWHMDFKSCPADPYVWMRPSLK